MLQEQGFHRLVVKAVVPETTDASTIVFDEPDDALPAFSYLAGQFLTLRMTIDGTSVTRCYSMSSAPEAKDPLHITVKRVPGGLASNWLLDNVRPGSAVMVRPPGGNFILPRDERPLLMFAGGSGITPIFSLIKSALLRGWPDVRLFYASRDARSEIFGAALSALELQYGSRLAIHRHHDSARGYPTAEALRDFISSSSDATAYVCGPKSFMDTCEAGLRSAGLPDERIHAEHFVVPLETAKKPLGDVAGYFSVERAGKTFDVPYRSGEPMLAAALAQQLPLPYSCLQGQCGACIAQLIQGTAEMPPTELLSDAELREGFVLLCQARAAGAGCRVKVPS